MITSLYIYHDYNTKNHRPSIDANIDDEVGTWSQQFLPIKAANTSIIYNHDQVNFYLPDINDLKFWHSVEAQFATGVFTIFNHLIWLSL